MKCCICNKLATGSISPDLDIEGIGFCDEHKDKVMFAYTILMYEGEDAFKNYIKNLKK